jgi:hypothetical protein
MKNIKATETRPSKPSAWQRHVGKRRLGRSTVLKVEEPAIVKQMRCFCSLQGDIAVINSGHFLGVVAMYC